MIALLAHLYICCLAKSSVTDAPSVKLLPYQPYSMYVMASTFAQCNLSGFTVVLTLRHRLLYRLPECSELELPSSMTTSHPPSRVIIQQETVGDRKYNSVVATTGLC